MQGSIELKDILFENVDRVLALTPGQDQQRFCESISKTIAMAFAGNNEGCPGFLQAIYYDETPVGIILIGRSPIGKDEPETLQKYEYAYRIWNFIVDRNYQRRGIAKAALKLALEKLKEYPEAQQSPVYLECHKENTAALSLYEQFKFKDINFMFRDGYCVLVRFPESRTEDEQ